jgi:hypothetical protein
MNEILWFSAYYLMVRPTQQSDYTVLRTSNGTKVCMFPNKHKFIYPQSNPEYTRSTNYLNETEYFHGVPNFYPTGIHDTDHNKVYSTTLASLI